MIELNLAQRNVRERALRFSEELLAPKAADRDRAGEFAADDLKALGRAGLLSVNVPAAHGGLGAGVVAYVEAVRALAQGCAGTAVAMMVTNMVAEAIAKFGTPEQRARYLKPLCAGEWPAAAFCLSEPESGSDAASMRATATREGDRYRLNGVKAWITSGGEAGVYLVTAKTDPAARAKGVTAFLVPAGAPGLSASPPEKKLGLKSSVTTQVVLEDCLVPVSQRLGEEGEGFKVMMSSLDGGRVGVSAQAVGVADAALAQLRAAYERAPGAELADALARSQAERDAAWLLCLRAARLKDAGEVLTQQASISKLYCTEMAGRVCQRALRAQGAAGHYALGGVERLMRDARVMRIYEGTSEIQRLVIAREALRAGARGG